MNNGAPANGADVDVELRRLTSELDDSPAGTCRLRVLGRESCRTLPRLGEPLCWRHKENPKYQRRLDRSRWCTYHRPRVGRLCQGFVLLGSPYCPGHDAREQHARAQIVIGLGGNPAALFLLLDRVQYSGRMNWEQLAALARAGGLFPRVGEPPSRDLVAAITRRWHDPKPPTWVTEVMRRWGGVSASMMTPAPLPSTGPASLNYLTNTLGR